jgi:hypothetical protein
MNSNKFKAVLGRGIMLAIPLAIVLYVFGRIVGIFKKIIAPLAAKMGIDRILGELTLTIFAIILIILIILLLGLLMQINAISKLKSKVEDVILMFIPSLNQLKLLAADSLDMDTSEISWRPILLYIKDKAKYNAAFIVEEDDEWLTVFVCMETSIRKGEVWVISKEKVSIIPTSYNELHRCSRAAGKGYIEIINAWNKKTGK